MTVPTNIEELAHDVRNAIYGSQVREAIASSMEATADVADWARQVAQDIVDGNFDEAALATEIESKLTQLEQDYAPTLTSLETEITDARGSFTDLASRLLSISNNITNLSDQVDGKIGDLTNLSTQEKSSIVGAINENVSSLEFFEQIKADKSYVDSKTQAVNISYKESYATLSDLQNAYPSGDAFNHAVLSDGTIYTWVNSSWTNTQIQANGTGIADNSITSRKIVDEEIIERKLFKGNFIPDMNVFSGSGGGQGVLIVPNYIIKNSGFVDIVVNISSESEGYIYLLEKQSGLNTFTVKDRVNQSFATGVSNIQTGLIAEGNGNEYIAVADADFKIRSTNETGNYFINANIADYDLTEYNAGLDSGTNQVALFVDDKPAVGRESLQEGSVDRDIINEDINGVLRAFESNLSDVTLYTPVSISDFSSYTSETTGSFRRLWISGGYTIDKTGVINAKIKATKKATNTAVLLEKVDETNFNVIDRKDVDLEIGINQLDSLFLIEEEGNYLLGFVDEFGSLSYKSPAIGFVMYQFDGFSEQTTQLTASPLTGSFQLALDIEVVGGVINQKIEYLSDEIKKNDSSEVDLKQTLNPVYSTIFDSVETDWQYVNATPTQNVGLSISGEGKAYFDKYMTFDVYYQKGVVEVVDTSSVFGLLSNWSTSGAVFLIDGVSGTANIYSSYDGTSIPAEIRSSENLDFQLVSGNRYQLEMYKDGWTHEFTITDINSGLSTTVFYDSFLAGFSNTAGQGWGGTGVISFSGSVIFKNHVLSVSNFPETKALVMGDSITEGMLMGTGVPNEARWSYKVRNNIYKGNAIISGRSGGTSADLKQRLDVINSLDINYRIAIILIGTNNRTSTLYAEWESDIVNIYNSIKSQGAVPVICIPPLVVGGDNYIIQMRDFILEKGWNTVRFDLATSLNRDGITADSNLFFDGVHPNALGGQAMFEQAKLDLGLI